MIDIATTIVNGLKEATRLDVAYELFVDSSTKLPAITYQIYNDYEEEQGDTLGYSKIQYMIKLWGEGNIESMTSHKREIDSCMKKLGFKRINYGELTMDNQICVMCLYEGLAKEII